MGNYDSKSWHSPYCYIFLVYRILPIHIKHFFNKLFLIPIQTHSTKYVIDNSNKVVSERGLNIKNIQYCDDLGKIVVINHPR